MIRAPAPLACFFAFTLRTRSVSTHDRISRKVIAGVRGGIVYAGATAWRSTRSLSAQLFNTTPVIVDCRMLLT